MRRGIPGRTDDERLLTIIDLKVKGRVSGPEIRRRFDLTNSALSGIMNRYRQSFLPCACEKPQNCDGGMPDRWWAEDAA